MPLTQTGAVLGTPYYMAPEQHQAARTDERTDQFSFCVALSQALYRQHPFGGDTAQELATNVLAGRVREHQHAVHGLHRGLVELPLCLGIDHHHICCGASGQRAAVEPERTCRAAR